VRTTPRPDILEANVIPKQNVIRVPFGVPVDLLMKRTWQISPRTIGPASGLPHKFKHLRVDRLSMQMPASFPL
jgi:hypothetical protein